MESSLVNSPAAERNQLPILAELRGRMPSRGRVLEVGAGTGQHGVRFAREFSGLIWLCTDRAEALPALQARIDLAGGSNLEPARALDVASGPWPEGPFSAAFSANTAHIMSWPEVECFIEGISRCLEESAPFYLYGPFNVQGTYTSPGNQAFDRQLRTQSDHMGLRDLEALESLAARHHIFLEEQVQMPANNFLLVFKRTTG